VTGLEYGDRATSSDSAATVTFASTVETVTGRGPAGDRVVTFDSTVSTVLANTGSGPAGSAGPFLTTLAGTPAVTLDTDAWDHGVSVPPATGGGGSGATAPKHDDMVVHTRSGAGTVDLLARLLLGQRTSSVTITECVATACTQSINMTNVHVSELTFGSALLADAAALSYERIRWTRTDGDGAVDFGWDIPQNRQQ
jgi:hypothetical protein